MKNKNIIIIFLIFLFSGCGVKTKFYEFEYVERVFKNDTKHYSILYKTDIESNMLQEKHFYTIEKLYIYTDVPIDKPMWIRGTHRVFEVLGEEDGNGVWAVLEIHIHSPQDIGGGGWNHGKFGCGQTSVVE